MNLEIKTTKGVLRGVREGEAHVFKNVPYAKPPVGELRFKRPVPVDPWEGVLDCTDFGKITVQDLPGNEKPWELLYYKEFYSDPAYLREMSEDCLNLNIWAPSELPSEKWPVAFWIHGGGFGGGFSSEIEFDGQEYVKRGVILVTVEYRCGALGFLAHPWLSEEDEKGISGNYGIFDQIAALDWVYENIAAFGGDPENITVFGQSAGCMSTQVLVSSPLTGNKIRKAILQSGVQVRGRFLATPTLKEEEEYGKRIVELTGAKNLEELRALPAEVLKNAKAQFDGEMFMKQMKEGGNDDAGGLMVVPNVDGYLLTKTVGDTALAGEMKPIPYMAGCVVDDLGTTDADRAKGEAGMILGQCREWCATVKSFNLPDAYCYLFARDMPDGASKTVPAFHTAEVWYMMGTLGRCWRPLEEHDFELSREMLDQWVCFMKTGAPTADGSWRSCTEADGFVKEYR